MKYDFKDRCWVEVDLDAIKHNVEWIERVKAPNEKIMAVVKSNAYGCGAKIVTNMLENEFKINDWSVANAYEAIKLRQDGVKGNILIFGYTPICEIKKIYELGITQTLISEEYAEFLHLEAKRLGVKLRVCIAVDTGMHRVGFKSNSDFLKVFNCENFEVEGVYSHLCQADSLNKAQIEFTKRQVDLFDRLTQGLKGRHIQNSAAIITRTGRGYDYIRPGIIIYGLNPSREVASKDIRCAVSLKSVISMVKTVKQGEQVGYGGKYKAPRQMRIATVPVGYADGYSRLFSNRGKVLVNGKIAKVVGVVCMDQLMIDVTDISCGFEDEVTLLGGVDGESIDINQAAESIGTIGYEVISGISNRVPRVYIKRDKITDVVYL